MYRTRAMAGVLVLALIAGLPVGVTAAGAGTQRCEGRVVTIQVGPDRIGRGTSGPDVIMGTAGDDVIRGGGGDDVVCAGRGNDRVVGGPGDDTVVLGRGRDTGRGNGGDDRLVGEGRDLLIGGSGVDDCELAGTRGEIRGCENDDDPGDDEDPEVSDCPTPASIGTTCRLVAPALDRTLEITAVRIADPAEPADDLGEGGVRLVAVFVRVTNRGSAEWSRGTFGVSLVDDAGTSYSPSVRATALGDSFGRPSIAPGGTRSGWVTFDLPTSADPRTLRWSECCSDQLESVSVAWRVS